MRMVNERQGESSAHVGTVGMPKNCSNGLATWWARRVYCKAMSAPRRLTKRASPPGVGRFTLETLWRRLGSGAEKEATAWSVSAGIYGKGAPRKKESDIRH